jgi:putative spermidine/putrescine transport system substrate-binding protein
MDPEVQWRSALSPYTLSRRRLLMAGGALASAVVLGACGSDDDDGQSGDTAAPSGSGSGGSGTTGGGAEPEKPGKIIVRSWGEPYSTSLEEFPGASFTEKTGIPVEFDLTDFPEVKAKVEQAVQANQRPPVDVVYTVTPDAYIASQQGYAASLDPAIVTNMSKLTTAGKPDDGTTNWVGIYTYTLPVVYRKDLVTLPETMDWDEMWDPKYNGQITFNLDPNLLVWPLSKMMGLDPATDDLTPVWEYCKELRPNIGAIVANDTELLELINKGEVSTAFALVGDAFFIENDNGAWKVPTSGSSLSSDCMYVPTGLPDNVTYWAQVFVNEVIDAQNQTAFNQAISAVPTNADATPADFMQGDPAFPFTDEEIAKYAVPVVNSVYAEHRDEWIEAFTVAIQG